MAETLWGDWGTTRLRLYRRRADGSVDRLEGPGIGALVMSPLETLLDCVQPWGAGPFNIQLCGMAGARSGLIEAPYAACPVSVDAWRREGARLDHGGHRLFVAAGLRDGDRDVMRGEETQIFGAIALDPALADGQRTIVLPGTHSKWVTLEDGVVTSFRTFFTGELFALLQSQSTLLRVAGADGRRVDEDDGWAAGLAAAQAGGILGTLFGARVAQLLQSRSHHWASGYLSGLLVGSEIAEAQRSFACDDAITLIGTPTLTARYAKALSASQRPPVIIDGDDAVLSGLELLDG
jgi:2-dehydro-3-deoxygalactonokinase